MTEATRNQTSVPIGNEPPVSQDHGATHTGVPPAASSHVRPQSNAPSSELPRQRDHVSRLSEGLEPMHIDDRIRKSSSLSILHSPSTYLPQLKNMTSKMVPARQIVWASM
jgi:hypothetical protein